MLHGYEKMVDDSMQGMAVFCKMILYDNLMFCNKADIKPTGICAVSYTHLDVYKRQVPY